MENKNLLPVYGQARELIIGYWNISEERFEKINQETMDYAAEQFLKGNSILPLAVRIMNDDVDGYFHTYRAIGSKLNDPRVIIYAEEVDGKIVVTKK